ncbi:MAG: YkgJ family cysteine cluster protein [Sphaerochaetaceae bacterium]|jgi:Fe-S-cluster containining protein|nr:YkgJ family cysteine cluster protein [Sphaerochaetaceae bacterium]MDY0371699.1 YkgJ family cysteine cluster protein [Sphaerochaetaceae bacterium]
MGSLDQVCQHFSQVSIAEKWRTVLDLYSEIEERTTQFQQEFNVHCPTGCGSCCEHFVPEITDLEASLIAAYILFVKKEHALIERLASHLDSCGVCPLYDASSPFHCTVYPARGMICRLFGVCPSNDKVGLPVLRKCKYSTDANQPREYGGLDFAHAIHPVPTMQQFAVQFATLDMNQETSLISTAVLRAIARLQFLANYIDSEPDPIIPTPLAS